MNLRIAKKIGRSIRRGEVRYSRAQVLRAVLLLYQSPMLITSKDANWTPANVGNGWSLRGRSILISRKCMVVEQREGIYDHRKRDGLIYFERRWHQT